MQDISEFYHILYHMVKAWPATYPTATSGEYAAKRPNSFAVLRSIYDLNADNVNKAVEHAKPPYFFVRGYDANEFRAGLKIEYPLLGVAEDTMTFVRPSGSGFKRQKHRLNLFVVDQLPFKENQYADAYSSARAIEEVGRDLRQIMLRLLHSFSNWQKLEFSSGPYQDGWHDVAWLKAHGEAAQWESVGELLQILPQIDAVEADVFYQGVDNCAVLYANIVVETNYCPDPVAFSYTYDEGGNLAAPSEKYQLDK